MSHWVFLRGLVREARHWGAFPATFRAALPEAAITTPNLPGNGDLHHLPSPTRIEAMLEHCRASLVAQGIAPPYHVLALSLGGMVARAWTQRYPDELAAAVLVSTSMRPHNPFYRRLRPANYPTLLNVGLGARDPARQEYAILRLTSCQPIRRPSALHESWTRYASEYPVSRINAARQLLAAARFRAQPGPPQVPTLLLAGGGDRLVHPDCTRRLSEVWGAPCAIHPHAGHDLPLDDGAWVADQVRSWLATQVKCLA